MAYVLLKRWERDMGQLFEVNIVQNPRGGFSGLNGSLKLRLLLLSKASAKKKREKKDCCLSLCRLTLFNIVARETEIINKYTDLIQFASYLAHDLPSTPVFLLFVL